MWRYIAIIVPFLLLLAALAGCTSEAGEQSDEGEAPPATPANYGFLTSEIEIRDDTYSPPERERDVGDRECVSIWTLGSAPLGPDLLRRTIEERVAMASGVSRVQLESISYSLPDRTTNNRRTLGNVRLEFAVLEHLAPVYDPPETVSLHIDVGYDCEYIENDDRDKKALARMSAALAEYFGDRQLIVFWEFYRHLSLVGRISYQAQSTQHGSLQQSYGLRSGSNYANDYWSGWDDGSQWLLQAEGTGDDQTLYFADPIAVLPTGEAVEETISLPEIRERAQKVIAEGEELGWACVNAHYEHQWYARSGEEDWYKWHIGHLGADGTPVECIAACNQPY